MSEQPAPNPACPHCGYIFQPLEIVCPRCGQDPATGGPPAADPTPLQQWATDWGIPPVPGSYPLLTTTGGSPPFVSDGGTVPLPRALIAWALSAIVWGLLHVLCFGLLSGFLLIFLWLFFLPFSIGGLSLSYSIMNAALGVLARRPGARSTLERHAGGAALIACLVLVGALGFTLPGGVPRDQVPLLAKLFTFLCGEVIYTFLLFCKMRSPATRDALGESSSSMAGTNSRAWSEEPERVFLLASLCLLAGVLIFLGFRYLGHR